MRISPSNISTNLLTATEIVLFPAPVLPTIPTFSPGPILKFNPSKTVYVPSRYLKLTFLNSNTPRSGQLGFKSMLYCPSPIICFSYGIDNIFMHLSAFTISLYNFIIDDKIKISELDIFMT